MADSRLEEILRRLALRDEAVIRTVLAIDVDNASGPWLEPRTAALVRLGALIAMDAPVVCYQSAVLDALSAGAPADEVVGGLVAVAPLVGIARVTSAASALGSALGYDLDAAFERLDASGAEAHERPAGATR